MAVYPLLYGTTPQADPGLAHSIAVSDVNDLQNMQSNLSGNYYLTGDIDASATSTWNGGAGFVPVGDFTGTLDGCGYTISGLYINRDSTKQGLFSKLEPQAKIANLTLSNVNITGGYYWVGAIAGFVESSDSGNILIQNCHVTGNIKSYDSGMGYYGGLVGGIRRNIGDSSGLTYIYDCSSSCTLNQVNAAYYNYRGGLVGYCLRAVIQNCYATGSLINPQSGDTSQGNGGLVGDFGYGDILYCYATGDVYGNDSAGRFYGGLVGFVGAESNISNSYAVGDISGVQEVGGLIGHAEGSAGDVYVTDCYATGNATSYTHSVGGLCGVSDDISVHWTNCYSIGTAADSSSIGGLVGSAHVNLPVTACFWDKEASGNETTSQNKGEGKITKWFRKQKHFTDVGWDFLTVWYLPAYGRQIINGKPRSSYPVNCPHTTHRNVFI